MSLTLPISHSIFFVHTLLKHSLTPFHRQLYALGEDENGTHQSPSAWIGGIESEPSAYSWVKLGLGGTGLASSDTFWTGNSDGSSVHKVTHLMSF